MTIVIIGLAIWLMIAVGVLHVYRQTVVQYPDAAPGGGDAAMIATAFAWPIVLAIAVIGLLALLLNALTRW
jgi:hypothetical protein